MHGQCDARPTVTFLAARHHRPLAGTKLYCLVTEACVCNNLPRIAVDNGAVGIRTRDLCHRGLSQTTCFYGSEQMVLMPLYLQESYWMQKRWSPVWISLRSTWVVGGSRKGIWPKLLPWASKSPTLIGKSESLNKQSINLLSTVHSETNKCKLRKKCSDVLPVKQYAYLCWPPIMKINYQYAQTYKQYKSAEKRWQTDGHMLRKFYSNLLGKENSTIYNSEKSYITYSSIYIG